MFGIPGLLYIPHYINPIQHNQLLETIDQQPWRTELARRTQHYGYVYDYRSKRVDPTMYLGELPQWLQPLATQLYDDGLIPELPDQAIINEPGQGIADHIDCLPCFGGVIISVSLASSIVLRLTHGEQTIPLLLEPHSVLVLRGPARYEWCHGIARCKRDVINTMRFTRARRLSVTFRKVIVR